MSKKKYYPFLIIIYLIIIVSCYSTKKTMAHNPLEYQSDNASSVQPICCDKNEFRAVKQGFSIQKVDNFEVFFDPSASMSEYYCGQSKFSLAKCLAKRFNETIPDLKLQAGLRTFGSPVYTSLVYGMEDYDKEDFALALKGITQAKGASPMEFALRKFKKDMDGLKGKTALIIFSDGKEMRTKDVEVAAERLVKEFSDRICIYPVLIGDDPEGAKLFARLAKIGNCGFFSRAEDIASAPAMTDFVTKIFLMPDSDQDGVPDRNDKCPDTPPGVSVDKRGCPKDSDNDGVWDNMDHCPNTPKGAKVDKYGCWDKGEVLFDFDKYEIKSKYYKVLDEIASVLTLNPDLKIRIEGHADIIGLEHYNVILSLKRAKSAKAYLVSKGIASKRISTTGFGYFKPRFKNDTPAHRKLNRRVEFKVISF